MGLRNLLACQEVAKGAGLGFAVLDAAGDEEVGVVEGSSIGVGEGVAELAAFVDGAGSLGGAVAADASGEGELLEELEEAGFVLRLVGVDLGVGAFEVGVGEGGGCSVAGAGDVDGVEVVLFDEAVHVDPDEGLAGIGAPMAEEAALDVVGLEGFAQEWVGAKVDHAGGEVVAGAPVGVHGFCLFGGEGSGGDGSGIFCLELAMICSPMG